jgi:hypothetical protein
MALIIGSYAQLGPYIDSILTANGDFPVGNPHKNFWDTLTYQQFTTGNVPGVVDPTTKQPIKILVVGHSAQSNFINILKGPLLGIPQMPFDGTPFTAAQIAPIAAWIDAGCPQ